MRTLVGELKAQEVELRAAIEAEGAAHTSPEFREWADLSGKFDLGEMFTNVMEHRASSGAIAEVQRERGLAANAIPTEMLMEKRTVTPAPGDVGAEPERDHGLCVSAVRCGLYGHTKPDRARWRCDVPGPDFGPCGGCASRGHSPGRDYGSLHI